MEGGFMVLIAAEPIDALSNNDVEGASASILQELLVSGSHQRCTADTVITIGFHQLPAAITDERLTQPDLIFDAWQRASASRRSSKPSATGNGLARPASGMVWS